MTDSKSKTKSAEPDTTPLRRGFLYKFVTILFGAVVALVPLVSGAMVFFDPLRRRQAQGERWIRVATLDAVPADGMPRQFAVVADDIDAWNRTADQPIGSVYLRREAGSDNVQALNAICPHAGCFVATANSSNGSKVFRCPCHTSSFSLTGEKLNLPGATNPSPRNMDSLAVDEDRLKQSGEVWVDFKNFYPGTHEQIVKG